MDTRTKHVIDLDNMSVKDQELVAELLLRTDYDDYLPGDIFQMGKLQVELKQPLVRRERRAKPEKSVAISGGDYLPNKRFEAILSPHRPLSEGSQANIFDVISFYIDNQKPPRLQLIQKKEEKKRVVKQFHVDENKRVNENDQLSKEHETIKGLSHLKAKKPTFGRCNFFVMRKLAGMDLFNRIRLDTDNMASCFKLAINLIDAYHTQVRKLNIVHNDIKPENIMVNKDDHASFIDYSFQTKVGEKSLSGTLAYWSPQRLKFLPPSFADDEYALVLSIAQVFNIIPNVFIAYPMGAKFDVIRKFLLNNKEVFDFSQSYLSDLNNSKIESELKQLFKAATAGEIKDRMNITEFRKQLEHIKLKIENEVKKTLKIK